MNSAAGSGKKRGTIGSFFKVATTDRITTSDVEVVPVLFLPYLFPSR